MRELNREEIGFVSGGTDACESLGSVANSTITADGAAAGIIAGVIIGGPLGAAVAGIATILGSLIGDVVESKITDACKKSEE